MNQLRLGTLFLSLICLGCSSEPTGVISNSIIGTWVLVGNTADRADGEYDMSRCRITFEEDGRIKGQDPCNSIFGSFTITSTTIETQMAGTSVACNGDSFREQLNAARSYSVKSDRYGTLLRLELPDGVLTLRPA